MARIFISGSADGLGLMAGEWPEVKAHLLYQLSRHAD